MNPPFHTTTQRLASLARTQPDARAITDGRTGCSYRDLALNVVRVLDALTAIGIGPGQVVGVETSDRFLHLLLLLACEAIGATTISLLPHEFEPDTSLGRVCDHILAEQPLAEPDAGKTFVLAREWLVQALRAPVADDRLDSLTHPPDPDQRVRLIKSSGTTGRPKIMGMTYGVQQRTIRNILVHAADHILPHPDYLCLYHFSIRGCHSRALMTLQLGGTIHFAAMEAARDIMATGAVNYALFVTGDLEMLVRSAPPGSDSSDIHIDVIGAALSDRLRQETARKLTRRILATYGANEVHHISAVGADGAGTLFPGVRVAIVNDRGTPLPRGQTGLIRIQSDTMTDGYIGAPKLTEAAFIDGWYHTGDLGFQPTPETLVVVGRADDMLNIGGVKVAPGPVVDQIKALGGIRDTMLASVRNPSDCEILLVAVETGSNDTASGLEHLINPILQRYVSAYALLPLPVFPRTETGKIRQDVIIKVYRETFREKMKPDPDNAFAQPDDTQSDT